MAVMSLYCIRDTIEIEVGNAEQAGPDCSTRSQASVVAPVLSCPRYGDRPHPAIKYFILCYLVQFFHAKQGGKFMDDFTPFVVGGYTGPAYVVGGIENHNYAAAQAQADLETADYYRRQVDENSQLEKSSKDDC